MTMMSDTPAKPRSPLRRTILITTRWSIVIAVLLALGNVTGCMERLFYIPTRGQTPIREAAPGTQGVVFNSADGTRLYGWLIPAHGRPETMHEHPTILHVHGNAGNIISHQWFTEHLPPAGFNVFLFDFRGYGQSEGSASRRRPLIADTEAALDALLARDDIDPDRIGMYGQSLGGSIGINVMAKRREIRAAVLESPFASWRDIAANALGGDPPFFLARWLATILIGDHERPLDAIQGMDRPVLILHGTADSIIPISHGRRMADAGGENVTLHELPGGDHNVLRSTHLEVDGLMIDFFREHLAPP
jgi:uncharacterized protein